MNAFTQLMNVQFTWRDESGRSILTALLSPASLPMVVAELGPTVSGLEWLAALHSKEGKQPIKLGDHYTLKFPSREAAKAAVELFLQPAPSVSASEKLIQDVIEEHGPVGHVKIGKPLCIRCGSPVEEMVLGRSDHLCPPCRTDWGSYVGDPKLTTSQNLAAFAKTATEEETGSCERCGDASTNQKLEWVQGVKLCGCCRDDWYGFRPGAFADFMQRRKKCAECEEVLKDAGYGAKGEELCFRCYEWHRANSMEGAR